MDGIISLYLAPVRIQTLIALRLLGFGYSAIAAVGPMLWAFLNGPAEGYSMWRDRPIQQDFTRSRTCVYFWFRARVT
jgi:hypothetical protein